MTSTKAIVEQPVSQFYHFHYAETDACKTIRLSKEIFPDAQLRDPPTLKPIQGPIYVLNIPFHAPTSAPLREVEGERKEGRESSEARLRRLLEIIRTQAFYEPDKKEAEDKSLLSRVFVIIGVNRHFSVDSEENEEFEKWMKSLPKITGLHTYISGRLWHPKWNNSNSNKVPGTKQEIEIEGKARAAYQVEKSKNVRTAERIKTYVEGQQFGKTGKTRLRCQTPFGQIRDWIKDTTLSQPWLISTLSMSKAPHVYLGCLDSDTLSLNGINGDQKGLLSFYDLLIASRPSVPRLMSAGYFFPANTDILTLLANIIDMWIRTKMAEHAPQFIYYPEPNLFVLLNGLGKVSFLGKKGNDTEGRRLVESLGPLDVARVCFVATRCLITNPPDRMIASKKIGQNKIVMKNLTKENFAAMRGISQSHFMQSVWASNVYTGLKIMGALQNVTNIAHIKGPLMNIFNVFDFPSFVVDWGSIEQAAHVYTVYLNNLEIMWSSKQKGEDLKLTEEHKYVEGKFNTLTKGMDILCKYMDKKWCTAIFELALNSGKAVHEVLSKYVEDFPKTKV